MARELDSANVDLIVAGHLHLTGTTEVNGIPIIQAGSQGETISIANALRDAAQAEVIASRPSVQAWQVAYRVCGSLGPHATEVPDHDPRERQEDPRPRLRGNRQLGCPRVQPTLMVYTMAYTDG